MYTDPHKYLDAHASTYICLGIYMCVHTAVGVHTNTVHAVLACVATVHLEPFGDLPEIPLISVYKEPKGRRVVSLSLLSPQQVS